MTLEARIVELAGGKKWSVLRVYGGAVAELSLTFRYCVSVVIDAQPIATTAAVTLEDAERQVLERLEEWARTGRARTPLRLVTT